MAAVGLEVAGSLFGTLFGSSLVSSGVVSSFVLLVLLSIFLSALCSSCRRQSFELQHAEGNRNPSSLVRVVRLEETEGGTENPLANEIQRDEKDGQVNGSAVVTRTDEPDTEEEVSYVRWRSHLGAPQSRGGGSPPSSDSEPDYQIVDERRSNSSDTSPSSANQAPEEEQRSDSAAAGNLSERDRNSMYAQVSKRVRPPPAGTGEEVQMVEVQVVEQEEEESPPLPDRMEG